MFLGIDIGTTAIKLGIIDQRTLLHHQTVPIKTTIYGTGESFQSASEVRRLVLASVKGLPVEYKSAITVIGFSVAMHSLLPVSLDREEQIYIWSDSQAHETISSFRKEPQAGFFYEQTGTPIHSMSPFAKILHFQHTDKFPAGTKWYGLKEWVMQQFTGYPLIDYSTASATGLFDLQHLCWSQEILDFLGIQEEQLGILADTCETFPILPSIADSCGLSSEVKIMIGASDGCLAAYAGYKATMIENSLTIGTSGAVRRIVKRPIFDRQRQNFCYYLNADWYVCGAPTNNGGCVLAWAAENLAQDTQHFFDQLPQLLSETEVGANGIRFLPYINGERAPFWSNSKKGAFENLTLYHTRNDMLRSVVEGLLLNIRVLKELTGAEEKLTISGGFFQTLALCQLTADILGIDCYLSDENEPIFGLYELYYKELEIKTQPLVKFQPDPELRLAYDGLAKTYFD